MKIKTIEIENFRAFYGKHKIDTHGKNMLIYGENGSGKSSFYHAIHDFFSNAYNPDKTKFVQNQWNKDDNNPKQSKIALTFNDDNTYSFTPEDAAPQEPAFIPEVGKQQPFFTYKRLLQTYLDDNVDKKMFHLLVDDILGKVQSNDDYTISQVWGNYVNLENRRDRLNWWDKRVRDYMDIFNDQFKERVDELIEITNSYLDKYFKNGVKIQIKTPTFKNVETARNRFRNKVKAHIKNARVKIEIDLSEDKIEDHQNFLNEARLSALSISMYLASLKVIPVPEAYKVMFLDDVFIGLDTSNRIPLLEIIKNEFTKRYKLTEETFTELKNEQVPDNVIEKLRPIKDEIFISGKLFLKKLKQLLKGTQFDAHKDQIIKSVVFQDWQIFITTYDRNWFEIAQIKLQDWKSIKMFSEEIKISGKLKEVPVILDSENYLEKAQKFFKLKEYAACANFQRKEVERLIKIFLPENYKYTSNPKNGSITPIDMIGGLSDKLLEYIQENDDILTNAPFNNLKALAKSTFNPFSHDDIKSPVYKKELQQGFELIENLSDLENIIALKSGSQISISKNSSAGDSYKYTIELRENLRILKQGAVKAYAKCEVIPLFYTKNGGRKIYEVNLGKLTKVYEMICHFVGVSESYDLYSDFISINDNKSLRVIIDEA